MQKICKNRLAELWQLMKNMIKHQQQFAFQSHIYQLPSYVKIIKNSYFSYIF